MISQVAKLQRASLKEPVKVEVSSKYDTVEKLQQFYVFIPAKYKVSFRKSSCLDSFIFYKFTLLIKVNLNNLLAKNPTQRRHKRKF